AARELNVRIISPDRPGIRDSTFEKNRRLIDWPEMVQQLANHLRLEQFHVLAISGGAPYAYATAWKLHERIRAAAIPSSAPPVVDLSDHSGLLALYRRLILLHCNWPESLGAFFFLHVCLSSIRP